MPLAVLNTNDLCCLGPDSKACSRTSPLTLQSRTTDLPQLFPAYRAQKWKFGDLEWEMAWVDWLAFSHTVGKMSLCLHDGVQIGTRNPDSSVLQQRQRTVLHNTVSLDSDVSFGFQNWWQRFAHFQVTLTWLSLLALPHSSCGIAKVNC